MNLRSRINPDDVFRYPLKSANRIIRCKEIVLVIGRLESLQLVLVEEGGQSSLINFNDEIVFFDSYWDLMEAMLCIDTTRYEDT